MSSHFSIQAVFAAFLISTATQAAPKAKTLAPAEPEFANRRPSNEPIWIGEKQVFEVTYIGLPAVKFTFEVLPHEEINKRKAYRVKGTAESLKLFSLMYKVHDTVESYFDHEGFFSHRFHLIQNESKQWRDSLESHFPQKAQTEFWNRWHPKGRDPVETKGTFPLPKYAQDYLSAMYYLRTVPLPDGAVVTFPVISEGNSFEAVATVERREQVEVPLGEKGHIVKMPAIVLRIGKKNAEGKVEKLENFVWLSDDARRFVLQIEGKVKIGYVRAIIKEFNPGQNPQLAQTQGEPNKIH